jgi:hypothetical protein
LRVLHLDLSLVEVQAIPGFRTLDEDLRSTLLNLFQVSSLTYWQSHNDDCYGDQRLLKIREFVGFLQQGF